MGVFSLAREPLTVVFVDDHGWHSFDQVAAALRRQGLRTVRVTLSPQPGPLEFRQEPPFRWLANRLFYDETIVLAEPEGRARLEQLLADGAVADVVAAEPALLAIGLASPLARTLMARSLAFHGVAPEVLLDKFTVNERLALAGVGTPRQIRADALSPAEAAQRLGLPLIIKDPIGAGGDGVRIARHVEEIVSALDELGGARDRLFYQEHIEGSVVIYGAIVGPGGALLEHGFRIEEAQRPLGPAAAISLDDDPALLDAGRRATELFGCRGFVSFGFLRSRDGRLLHIDANCRVWGMIMTPTRIGIDFTRPYVALLNQDEWHAPALRPQPSSNLPVLPFALNEAVAHGTAAQTAACAGPFLKTFWTTAGAGYCLHAALNAGLLGLRRLRRRIAPSEPRGPKARAPHPDFTPAQRIALTAALAARVGSRAKARHPAPPVA